MRMNFARAKGCKSWGKKDMGSEAAAYRGQDLCQNEKVGGGNQTSLSTWMLCLEEDLDKEIYVVLRDGRQFTGIFRSFDQYGSLCLERSFEIFSDKDKYSEVYQGCMVFRGDNLMLCGLIDQKIKNSNAKKVRLAQILRIKQEEKSHGSSGPEGSSNVFEWITDDSI